MELRSGRESRWALFALLGFALLLRAAYLAEYVAELPFAYGPLGDTAVYLAQARDILAGKLGTPPLVAFSPGYGYVLALLTDGSAALSPIVVQLLLGVLSLWFVAKIGAELFGAWEGVAAAVLLALYPALMFFETKLLAETVGLSLLCCGLWSLAIARRSRSPLGMALLAGLALAAACLTRASLVFTLPLFVVAAAFPFRSDDGVVRERVVRALGVALGIGLLLGLNGTVNYAYGGRFIPVIAVSRTLESASKADWHGSIGSVAQGKSLPTPWDVVTQYEEGLRAEREGRLEPAPSTVQRLLSLDYFSMLRSIPGKWKQTFSGREATYQYGFLGERSEITVLAALPVTFATLGVCALVGLGWALIRTRRRALWLLAPVVLGTLATVTLYHPSSRYRLPLVLPLALLGGLGVVRTFALRAASRWHMALALLLVLGVGGSLLHGYGMKLANYPEWYLQLAGSHYNAGERRTASAYAAKALALAPQDATIRIRAQWFLARVPPPPQGSSAP